MSETHDGTFRLGRFFQNLWHADDPVRHEAFGEVVYPPELESREITVHLPAGFRPGDEVPLLFALDGQNMFRWRLPETMMELQRDRSAEAPVVVAVASTPARKEEYGVAGVLDYAGRGRFSAEFQGFITRTLLPAVRSRYGVGLDPRRTGIVGASLGGLAAFDTAWRHPDLFSLAGVFSGSLWWRAEDRTVEDQQTSRIAHRRVRDTAGKPPLRFWFQAGTEDETEDRDGNGVIDAIQDTTELIDELAARGFVRGSEVVYRETPGGRHEEATWAGELPGFLRWAWPAR